VLGLLPLLESGRMLRHRLAVELERKKAWMLRDPVGFDLKFASGVWMDGSQIGAVNDVMLVI
jgi:hypothetical protein